MLALARCGAGVTCNEFADSSWHSTTLSVEPGPMAVANPLSSLRTVLQQPSSSGYRSRSHENTEQPVSESLPAQWAQTLEPVQLETFISVPVKNCQKKFVANSKKLSSVQRPLGSSGQTLGTGGWGVRILNIATKSVQSFEKQWPGGAHVTNERVSWPTTKFCQKLVTQCQPGWEAEQCSNSSFVLISPRSLFNING